MPELRYIEDLEASLERLGITKDGVVVSSTPIQPSHYSAESFMKAIGLIDVLSVYLTG